MYSVVAVLFKAGDHVPVIPLFDVVGSAVRASPEQIAATGLNVGSIGWLTVTSTLDVFSQSSPSVPVT